MPSLPPPVAVPPLTLRQRRKGAISLHLDVFLSDHYPQPSPAPEERDWLGLPLDATLSILRRLDPVELLVGGVAGACRSWRRATRDEPSLWRHIDMRGYPRCRGLLVEAFAREAVLRSEGMCESFWGEAFGGDDFLLFLAEQAPSLRSLRLDFFKITNEGFVEAIRNFPLLEELELKNCHGVKYPELFHLFELVDEVCPRMKHFRRMNYRSYYYRADPNCDIESLAIANMHQLRSLQLFRNKLTNEGLTAIIDNSPGLEFHVMHSCSNIVMDEAMRAKCARIERKIISVHDFEDHDHNFEEGSNISFCSSCLMFEYFRNLNKDTADSEDQCDPYCYYLSGDDEINLEEHGRMMLGKSVQKYNL
ncbi:hypothetical protein ACQ4PT_019181 [Festuca glaucescens]